MPSKPVLVKTTLTPRTLPNAWPRSGSKPTMVLLSFAKDSTGAYDASVAILRTPADLMLSGRTIAPVLAEAVPEPVETEAVAPGALDVAAGGAEVGVDEVPPAPAPAVELLLPQAALVSAKAPTARVTPVRRADRVTILNVTSSKGDGSVRRRDPPSMAPEDPGWDTGRSPLGHVIQLSQPGYLSAIRRRGTPGRRITHGPDDSGSRSRTLPPCWP